MHVDLILLIVWLDETAMHSADAYASITKGISGNLFAQINMVRSTNYAMNVQTNHILGSTHLRINST